MANTFEMTFDPDAFVPDPTNHPDRGVVQGRVYLAFDASTIETVRSKAFRMPSSFLGTGTLKAAINYAMATATSGKVAWRVYIEAITPGDAVDTDSAESFDSANAGNETVPGTAGYESTLEITLANADGVAAGDSVRLKVDRNATDGTNDTASGDGRIYWVALYEVAP